MSSSRTEDIPIETIIELIKANARALYGRHLTYEVITTGPKVHALLIGYDNERSSKGQLLKGAYTRGVGRAPPSVGHMIRMLFDETRADVSMFVDRLNREVEFDGGLLQEGKGDVDVDDGIDGMTLRGD